MIGQSKLVTESLHQGMCRPPFPTHLNHGRGSTDLPKTAILSCDKGVQDPSHGVAEEDTAGSMPAAVHDTIPAPYGSPACCCRVFLVQVPHR